MPKGPQGQKRPADAIGLAVMIGKIATGEIEETVQPAHTKARVKAAKSRAKSLSPAQRSEIASAAAQARWKKSTS